MLAHLRRHFQGVPPDADAAWLPPATPAADAFFAATAAHPAPAQTATLTVLGQPVPVFFGGDLVSSIFFWLSGWQEVYSAARDGKGRFPFAASIQAALGCVAVPVADYLTAALTDALTTQHQLQLTLRAPGLNLRVSHDVDHLLTGWRAALRRGHGRAAVGRLLGLRPDPFDNLMAVAQLVQQATGGRSTFYFLGAQGHHSLGPNADYDLATPTVQARIQQLRADFGAEIGLHGSFGSSDDAAQLRTELGKLGVGGAPVRFHYLRFDPARTPAVLAAAGARTDTTLGFAERAGFRHGTARAFALFDFSSAAPLANPVVARPLHLMDVTFVNPAYQPTPAADIPAVAAGLAAHVRRLGGTLEILWHNEYLVPWETRIGEATFRAVLAAVRRP